jgi:hypothetical protein
LKEVRSFYAERIISNVADADGPDGQSDGLIAFKEGSGVQASTKNLLQTELWENNNQDYIDRSDLPNINCQGNKIRCLKSLDVSTKQSGWGTSKNKSYKIEIDG